MAKLKYTVLVIDDDTGVLASVSEALQEHYEQVITFTEPEKALENIDILRPDVILLDVFPGNSNSLGILETLHDRGMKMPIILMIGFSDIRMAVRGLKLGAEDFLVKPLDNEQIEVAVQRALKNYDLRRQMDILRERLIEEENNEILGNSEVMREIIQFADIFAQSDDTTVLILGESGTGKELMAKYIHNKSPRAHGPFISVNCGAIPRELAENELFGYERGAFTGATEKIKPGRFEMAHRGTILLDEVGELSLDMQVKLLRVLQERRFYRLGGAKEVAADVRVIAATNRNLEKMVEEGKFREDLYYRLNVGTILMPPLRERFGDILLLSTAFLREFNKKFGKQIEGFTTEAIEILKTYEWKGNIREMRNIIERVTLLETTTEISKDSLKFLKTSINTHTPSTSTISTGKYTLSIPKQGIFLEDVVRDLIRQTLQICQGNQVQTAKMLGITRASLRTRMEQLNIEQTGELE